MSLDLNELGFSKEELQERVIERIVELTMSESAWDADGQFSVDSEFSKSLAKRVEKKIEKTIDAMAQKHVLPNVASYIENLCLQETNKWGEKVGVKITFLEYLVSRAEAYMQEQVDSDGKGKAENNSSYWTGKQTRITHLIHKHLHYSIETAMKGALTTALGSLANGLHETARLKLNEIAASMKVELKTK